MLDEHILSCGVVGLTEATAVIILFCAIDQTDDGVVYTHEEVMANLLDTFNETSPRTTEAYTGLGHNCLT